MARGGGRTIGRAAVLVTTATIALLLGGGCVRGPWWVAPQDRKPIDRKFVEYPAEFDLEAAVTGLTAPTSVALVHDEGPYQGAILVAEGGAGGFRPRVYGFKPDGTYFEVHPPPRRSAIERVPVLRGLQGKREIYGP